MSNASSICELGPAEISAVGGGIIVVGGLEASFFEHDPCHVVGVWDSIESSDLIPARLTGGAKPSQFGGGLSRENF